jgi:hypothetical protein
MQNERKCMAVRRFIPLQTAACIFFCLPVCISNRLRLNDGIITQPAYKNKKQNVIYFPTGRHDTVFSKEGSLFPKWRF